MTWLAMDGMGANRLDGWVDRHVDRLMDGEWADKHTAVE